MRRELIHTFLPAVAGPGSAAHHAARAARCVASGNASVLQRHKQNRYPAPVKFPFGIIPASGDAMLRISRDLTIDENDIEISFVRASGPGDRTSTSSRPQPNCVSTPGGHAAGGRRGAAPPARRPAHDQGGVIADHAQRCCTQLRAGTIIAFGLLRTAMTRPVPRRATKPTLG